MTNPSHRIKEKHLKAIKEWGNCRNRFPSKPKDKIFHVYYVVTVIIYFVICGNAL